MTTISSAKPAASAYPSSAPALRARCSSIRSQRSLIHSFVCQAFPTAPTFGPAISATLSLTASQPLTRPSAVETISCSTSFKRAWSRRLHLKRWRPCVRARSKKAASSRAMPRRRCARSMCRSGISSHAARSRIFSRRRMLLRMS